MTIISSNQMLINNVLAKVDGWCLILLKFGKKKKNGGYLVTIDFENAVDSLDHDLLVIVSNKFGFWSNFINWIKLLRNSQQSCVINGGNNTPSYYAILSILLYLQFI